MVTSVDLGAREYYTPSTAQTPILAALPSGIFEKSSSLVASAAQRGYFDVPVLAFFFLLLCVVRCVLFREPPPRIVSASFPPPRGMNGVLTTGLYSARRRIGTWYRFSVSREFQDESTAFLCALRARVSVLPPREAGGQGHP